MARPLAGLHPTLALNLVSTVGWTSLRRLQQEAIEPVTCGDDALLVPAQGATQHLLPRLELHGGWTGRRVGLWHGDTSASQRKSILTGPPDLLLTTPESLESIAWSSGEAAIRSEGKKPSPR